MKPPIRFRGPSLTLLAIVHILLFEAGFLAAAALRHGPSFVSPVAPAEQVRLFFAQSPFLDRLTNFFLFGSAVPLGIFAVTAVSRLRYLGIRAAGTNITLLGGLTATFALFLSGMAGWILSVPEVLTSAPLVKAIFYLSFLSGGALYAMGFGLMAAGISITSHYAHLLPRWIILLGLLVALAGELSWFSLLTYPANFFIPVTRFIGFIWMLLTAIYLTKSRNPTQLLDSAPIS
ncbi:MAG: hypothetical protein WB439_15575 [Acidobacteriaceae bacterium]